MLVERLIDVLSSSSSVGGAEVIEPGAVLIVDGGGHTSTAATPVRGRDEVVEGLRDLMTAGTTATLASINGSHGITLVRDERVVGVMTVEIRAQALSTIWVVCNPEKLRHWNPR